MKLETVIKHRLYDDVCDSHYLQTTSDGHNLRFSCVRCSYNLELTPDVIQHLKIVYGMRFPRK